MNQDKKGLNKIKLMIDDDIDANKKDDGDSNIHIENTSTKKSKYQKSKQRKSRLIISEDNESSNEHRKEIYEGDTKLLKCLDSAILFNDYINSQRHQHSKHFLKRKLKFTYEREDKCPMFWNVPFLPKSDMFNHTQLVNTQQYFQQQGRNINIPNINKNYPPNNQINVNYNIRNMPINNPHPIQMSINNNINHNNLNINNNPNINNLNINNTNNINSHNLQINNNNINHQQKGLFQVNTNNMNINTNPNSNINNHSNQYMKIS